MSKLSGVSNQNLVGLVSQQFADLKVKRSSVSPCASHHVGPPKLLRTRLLFVLSSAPHAFGVRPPSCLSPRAVPGQPNHAICFYPICIIQYASTFLHHIHASLLLCEFHASLTSIGFEGSLYSRLPGPSNHAFTVWPPARRRPLLDLSSHHGRHR